MTLTQLDALGEGDRVANGGNSAPGKGRSQERRWGSFGDLKALAKRAG